MHCNGCGSDQFNIDEVSGRYVCVSCWQVSEVFEGFAHDVIEGATAKQGLRVIHNAASQRDLFGPQSNSNAITSDHSHPFEGFISTTQFTSTIKQEPMDVDKENELENPKPTTFVDEGIDFDAVLTNGKIFGKVQCDRTKFRRWRMSEPLALLLRYQLAEIIRVHLLPAPSFCPGYIDRFRSLTRTFWTNYLAITGELGGDVWAGAFHNVCAATQMMLKSRDAYFRDARRLSVVTTKLPSINLTNKRKTVKHFNDEKVKFVDKDAIYQSLKLRLGKVFHWAGWGALYNPIESQHVNNPLFLFGEQMGSLDDQIRRVTYEDEDEAYGSIGSSEIGDLYEIAENLEGENLVECAGYKVTDAGTIKSLAKKWRNMIVLNLKNNIPKEDIFWQAHESQKGRRYLLEYNLSILFLAALFSGTQYTENRVPICRYDMLTLSDITLLCTDFERFPYLAGERWISKWFVCFNGSAYRLFRRRYPPDLPTFAHITSRLMIMLGIPERPRLPLCSMVHRHLRDMGLPSEVHTVADTLIAKLGRYVEACCTKNRADSMHYLLPMDRYVRGEVFAMAVVVVVARLVFKLDGDFEYRLSKVARYLADHGKVRGNLRHHVTSIKPSSTRAGGGNEASVPFEWTAWICCRSKAVAATTQAIAIQQRKARTRHCQSAAPFNTATSHIDLVRSVRTQKEFYGPGAAFDPQNDVGWGENLAGSRLHSSKKFKLSMTDSLSCFVDNSTRNGTSSHSAAHFEQHLDDGVYITPTCNFCAQRDKSEIFQRKSENNKWSKFNCDALIGAHSVIDKTGIKISTFLKSLLQDSKEIYKDWLYILKHYISYDPINSTDLFMKPLSDALTSDFPAPVNEAISDHEKNLCDFMSGKLSEPDPNNAISSSSAKTTEENIFNTSLNWFMKTASNLCGARLTELLVEVQCVQHLLKLIPLEDLNHRTRESNIALAYHFDYRTSH